MTTGSVITGMIGARDVPEEEEDHQRHRDEDLDDGGLQVVDGPPSIRSDRS